jgi:hypothetical protein
VQQVFGTFSAGVFFEVKTIELPDAVQSVSLRRCVNCGFKVEHRSWCVMTVGRTSVNTTRLSISLAGAKDRLKTKKPFNFRSENTPSTQKNVLSAGPDIRSAQENIRSAQKNIRSAAEDIPNQPNDVAAAEKE